MSRKIRILPALPFSHRACWDSPLRIGWIALLVTVATVAAEPVPLRIVAANLTSGNEQTYSPDNANHSNPEGAGARILRGLHPDVVLIQEFNTTIPVRQWVNQTLGSGYAIAREPQEAVPNFIPNGVLSRYPIVASGEWDDPTQENRDFVWAKIALPNGRTLWAVSVHLYSKKAPVRTRQAHALLRHLRTLPPNDLVVLGGDLNTRSRDEECIAILHRFLRNAPLQPADAQRDEDTNARRNRPYDWILADADLEPAGRPVRIGARDYPGGLVFDSRVFEPLSDVPPVQRGDSATPNMQHMAVVRDFLVP